MEGQVELVEGALEQEESLEEGVQRHDLNLNLDFSLGLYVVLEKQVNFEVVELDAVEDADTGDH
jgi:hypothetical protein